MLRIGLMPKKIDTIKKHSDFINIKLSGKSLVSKSLILQKLFDSNLNNSIKVGFITTKKIGTAVKRNRAKRLMRSIVREIINKYGKNNFAYVLIARKAIFDAKYDELKEELHKMLKKNE